MAPYTSDGIMLSKAMDEQSRSVIERLQERLGQQNLLLQALAALLIQKGVITEEELRDLHDRMDALDGAHDGKLVEDKKPITCKDCGAKNSPDKTTCLYCGHELPKPLPLRRPPPPIKL